MGLMMLLFATITVWFPWLFWFWVSLIGLVISPFIFNPHQFAWNDFFIDYRDYLRWLSRGNSRSHASSWIAFCRLSRTRLTGFKRKVLGSPSEKLSGDVPRARLTSVFFAEIVGPLVLVAATLVPYLFINAQTGVRDPAPATQSLIRVAIVAFAPIAVNAGVLAGLFAMACCMGPVLSMCCKKFGSVLAAIAHGVAVFMLLAFWEVMFFLEGWIFAKALLGMVAVVAMQRWFFKLVIALALTREFKSDTSNIAWWTGKWYAMGWHSMSQPAREYLCKITELGFFAADFILGHIILFIMLPALCVPYIDKFHSVMLFWLRPSRQIRPPIYSIKQSRLRRRRVIRYAILYFVLLILFVVLFVGPVIVRRFVTGLPSVPMDLMQPTGQDNNDTMASVTGSVLIPGLGSQPTGGGGGGGGGDDTAATSAAGGDDGGDAFPSDAFGLGGGNRFVRW